MPKTKYQVESEYPSGVRNFSKFVITYTLNDGNATTTNVVTIDDVEPREVQDLVELDLAANKATKIKIEATTGRKEQAKVDRPLEVVAGSDTNNKNIREIHVEYGPKPSKAEPGGFRLSASYRFGGGDRTFHRAAATGP